MFSHKSREPNTFTATLKVICDFQCSATCGKGRRGRYVSCRDRLGNMVEETSCLYVPKPVSQEACQVKACGKWQLGDWSQVSFSLCHIDKLL